MNWVSVDIHPTSVQIIPVLLFFVVEVLMQPIVLPLFLMINHSRERDPLG